MTETFTLHLPLPPSVNRLHIGNGANRRRAPQYAAWADEAGWRVNEAKAAGTYCALPPDVWYWTDVRLPANHLGDSDNRLKALHDLLVTMQATPDDRWLLGGTYLRCPSVDSGMCVVSARTMPDGPESGASHVERIAEGVLSLRQPQTIGEVAARLVAKAGGAR